MGAYQLAIAGLLMLVCRISEATISDQTSSALLPLEARNVDSSGEEDVISNSYVLPNQIFNDGKPYYARQDPVSGQLDFTAKKPAGIEPEVNEVLNSKEKIVLSSSSTPNIHDFLNLPVKYSSSKFVYPLVSSSYANLKYQGSNKNYITNKKPTMVVAPVTPVVSNNYYTVTTTKLTAVPPTEAGYYSSTKKVPTRTSAATSTSTLSTTIRTTPTTTTTSTTTTTRQTTTGRTTTTRRPFIQAISTTPQPIRTTTTRKKFMPIRKQTIQTTTTARITEQTAPSKQPTTPKQQPKPTQSSSDVKFTTHHPTPSADIFPTEPTTTTKMYSTPRNDMIASGPTTPRILTTPHLKLNATKIPNLDPADVYYTLGQKNTKAEQEQQSAANKKPTMTLSDIFNNLAEEENAVANNYQQNQGFDAQGNLIEPIAPSQPSPFAMQQPHSQQTPGPPTPTHYPNPNPNEQKVTAGSLENYGNQYVSYQVQQPNVMQYRPIPGQINNVVISPGQQSASFVLGSQQQVSHSHPGNFGNVEKDTGPFPQETAGVQYGQVINEEINIKRPQPPTQQQQHQQQQQQQFPSPHQPTPPSNQQQMPNYQSNIKYQSVAPVASEATVVGTVLGTGIGVAPGSYPEPPPEAPSPYQQLPLIGSNSRPAQKQSTSHPNAHQKMHPTLAAQSEPTDKDTKELLVSSNIRFPSKQEDSLELASTMVASGPPTSAHINGHAQPLSLQQIQNANPVVFPKLSDDEGVQIQQHEVVNLKQHEQHLKFPTQQLINNEQLAQSPSRDMEPPPRYAPLHNPSQAPSAPGKPFYMEFDRKSQHPPGPRPNVNLPNILPQFRPNAKISAGHGHGHLKPEPGNIRLPMQGGKLPYNPSTPPQFANRRQPLQQQYLQKRYPLNRMAEYEHGPPVNRRVYRVPPNNGQRLPQLRDRMYPRRPQGPMRPIDNYYPVERNAPIAPEAAKLVSADLSDFEEEDLVINDPPQAPTKDMANSPNDSKLEAVITLQMLQSQKKINNGEDTGAGEIQVTADNDPQEANDQKSDPNNIYAVYASKADTMLQTNTDGPSGVEYQNTPFSVIRDQPQEPILKNKKPQSLQQQSKMQPLHKQKFPYPIEKPDPSYTELQQSAVSVPGVLIAPRIINSAMNTGTEAPIAIAYTPTEPNPFSRNGPAKQEPHHLNKPNAAETQTEEVMGIDFDLRGHNYEKNFMAPFYPSVSLGGASGAGGVTNNPPLTNWKIVPSASNQQLYEKNNINRADVDRSAIDQKKIESKNSTTEKYSELDHFQPELQGGFRPIYPADYMHLQEQQQETTLSNERNKPLALALVGSLTTQTPQTVTSVGTTPNPGPLGGTPKTTVTSTTTAKTTADVQLKSEAQSTTTTTKSPVNQLRPTAAKKSTFETSLAALLFGDDDEYEDGARKSVQNPKPAPRPINVARMGPRSLFAR
ncbi:uncharacterized protein LOC6567881 [Drosophila grimshawi]|uniref:uncharacterized protein LOC6567881 n=1 Tax=Drosophila grimshawi TaxID=7222 RepID=UPI0013EF09A5|nr:uncharacterized protein LOC6567881 [Drosophila grimshawi]